MDIQLHRLDLLQCGALQPGTLEVLPVGKKKQQKIAVGAATNFWINMDQQMASFLKDFVLFEWFMVSAFVGENG